MTFNIVWKGELNELRNLVNALEITDKTAAYALITDNIKRANDQFEKRKKEVEALEEQIAKLNSRLTRGVVEE